MRLGNEAAKFVSVAFPNPMELKFERIAQPFMLLHVNRCSADMPPLCLTSSYGTTRGSVGLWSLWSLSKYSSFTEFRRVKKCPGRGLLIAIIRHGYLVENSLGHAVSGLLDAESCNHDIPCTCVGSCHRGKLMQTCCRAGEAPCCVSYGGQHVLQSSSACMTSLV